MGLNSFAILNEETVVALCFVAFIRFSFQSFGPSIGEALDERKDTLKAEFHQALVLEQSYCQQLIHESEMPLKKIQAFLTLVHPLMQAKLAHSRQFCSQASRLVLEQNLTTTAQSRLNEAVINYNGSQKIFQERLLNFMAVQFNLAVLREFEKPSLGVAFKERLLVQSLTSVKTELI